MLTKKKIYILKHYYNSSEKNNILLIMEATLNYGIYLQNSIINILKIEKMIIF